MWFLLMLTLALPLYLHWFGIQVNCPIINARENRQDNQEWAAGNIGHNTQNEDKQNKINNTNIENQKHKQQGPSKIQEVNSDAHED